ncbi:elongin BC and Polycomb repressive complex 2-associated protein [Gopherus flavomarginatus]|uniref:elongin BC and Polycomb repressive complex 2-associated protein n=1 Tax=Gopherus flavomarginatus TaxID=286002 RepID=UPI0021CC07CA|nr:elongin BC and Polycomb repressive complex 2-associated protein [Gopherus flavomarginatus]
MFLTCEGTFGMVPATVGYNGEFQTGYQEIEGINLGYLQINGTQMFALAQVLSDLFKDIPRTTISKKMESLKIKSRRCDLRELRTLKAINSVPTRAVKCSLISKADLEALCTSCKSLSPRRRKRKRREQLLLPGPADLFDCPRPPLRSSCGAGPYRTQEPGSCGELAPAPHHPPGGLFQNYDKATRGRKGYGLGGREGLFAGVLSAYPRDLQLLHSAARGAHGAGQAHPQPEPGRPKRCSKGLFPEEKGQGAARKSRLFPGCKRQGTSAGYSSDSDSSLDFGGSSPATSSDSSEEEEEEEGDTSCSSEEGSSSESESSSLCSGDSVQSTRYRQAALPRFQQLHHPPREPSGDERLPELHKAALRPDPNLLLLSQQLWARTLRASTLESLRPLPALGAGVQQQQEPELACAKQEPPSSQPSQGCSYPGGDPQQKAGDCGATKPCAQGEDLHKDASNNAASLGPSDQAKRQLAALAGRSASQEPALGSASLPSAQEFAGSLSPAPQRVLGEPRREHFDRLIRQSKLWCYAKGFNADGKSLRPGGRTEPCKAAELQCSGSKSAPSPSPLSNKALKGNGSERNSKRRRLARGAEAERQQNSAKGRPQKTPRRNAPKGKTQCKRLACPGPAPGRNSFSLLGNFPCTPSLVVGEDGDLRPAASLCVKNSCALSKTHPLWSWQVGGSALPVPPSLKFRGYGLEGF